MAEERKENEVPHTIESYIKETIEFLNSAILDRGPGMTDVLLFNCCERADNLFALILENAGRLDTNEFINSVVEIQQKLTDLKTRMMLSVHNLHIKRANLTAVVKQDYEKFKDALLSFNNLAGTMRRGRVEDLQPNFEIPRRVNGMLNEINSTTTDESLQILIRGYYTPNADGSSKVSQPEIQKQTHLLNLLCEQFFAVEGRREEKLIIGQLPNAVLAYADKRAEKTIKGIDEFANRINSIGEGVANIANQIMNGFYGICAVAVAGGKLSILAMDMAERILRDAHGDHSYFSDSETESAASSVPPMKRQKSTPSIAASSASASSAHSRSATSIQSAQKSIRQFNNLIGVNPYDSSSTVPSDVFSDASKRQHTPEFMAFSSSPIIDVDVIGSGSVKSISIKSADSTDEFEYLEGVRSRFKSAREQLDAMRAAIDAVSPDAVSITDAEITSLIVGSENGSDVMVYMIEGNDDNDIISELDPGELAHDDIEVEVDHDDDEDDEEEGDEEEMRGGKRKTRRNKSSIKKRANKKARTTRRKRAAKTRRAKKRRSSKKRRTTRKR